MENYSYFYQAATKIAEDRIKELIQHAKDAEAGSHVFPDAGSYFRECAQIVYLAWRDFTDKWHTASDRERLETLIDLTRWNGLALRGEIRNGANPDAAEPAKQTVA
jgi:hypothetical protein